MLFYLLMGVLVSATEAQNLSVQTSEGVVVGARAADGNYYTFYGLRYGGSTAGTNRFKAPTTPAAYPGEFHAIEQSVICAQPSSNGLVGTEDCLRLNIFTTNTTTPKPVLVWIMGEEYTATDNRLYSFRRLVEEGIVVVTLNYRVSIFGFLCLGVADAPGNAGLRDVVHGLKWIQQNIAGFGGNPNNVVLFGHGSGGAMVDLITMSPQSEGLIHKAIAQSGSALAPWAVAFDPVGYAELLGAKLGYTGKTRAQLANLLADTDLSLLISALQEFKFLNNTALFAPCIENANLNPSDTFLSDAPLNLLRAGKYSHIPYLAGYTNREGTLRADEAVFNQWLEKMQENFTQFLPVDLNLGSETNGSAVERSIRQYYFVERQINMELIEDYLTYHGDTLVLLSTVRGVRERALTSRADVRLYEFAYRGTRNSDWTLPQIPLNGVRHGGVLNYLLDFDLISTDETIMWNLIRRYTAFINTGVPTLNSTTVDWLAVNNNTYNFFYYGGINVSPLTVTAEPRTNPHNQRMTFWTPIYEQHYKAPVALESAAPKILSYSLILIFAQFVMRLL